MPSTPASVLAALALAGSLVGVGAVASAPAAQPDTRTVAVETRDDPTPPAATGDTGDTVSIECGGYDAEGDVTDEAATRIDRAPVDDAGIPLIPPVCGGYTADGEFIGDD